MNELHSSFIINLIYNISAIIKNISLKSIDSSKQAK